WSSEEVTLEVVEAGLLGSDKLLPRFYLLRQHAAGPRGVTLDQSSTLLGRGDPDVHLDDVGQIRQRLAGVTLCEVVERDPVPREGPPDSRETEVRSQKPARRR